MYPNHIGSNILLLLSIFYVFSFMFIFLKAIPLHLLPYEPHLFSMTQYRFILIQNGPSHVC